MLTFKALRDKDELSRYLHLWPEIVQRYTRTELTYPDRDKLTALSGLAQFLGRREDYFAGLWIQQLPYTLAWRAESPTSPPAHYQAPSWSWASINGNVQLPPLDIWDEILHPDFPSPAKFINAEIQHYGDDYTGRIKYGRIRLKAPMARFELHAMRHTKSSHDSMLQQDVMAFRSGRAVFHIAFDRVEEFEDEVFHFALIFRALSLDLIAGILLKKNWGVRGRYRRVGYFETAGVIASNPIQRSRADQMKNLLEFQRFWKDYIRLAMEDEFEEIDKDGATITIS